MHSGLNTPVDWNSKETSVLMNPRLPAEDKQTLLNALENDSLQAHVWLTSSGTSGKLKWVALSKEALLVSAAAVNKHLESDHSDVWLNTLPEFHVGGLAISARAYLSGASVSKCVYPAGRWNPHEFVISLRDTSATLTSLVPAQVYDLVTQRLMPPVHLRAVVVGGGAVSERLYFEAVTLGWKLLLSYGLTECSSQVATAKLGSWLHGSMPLLYPLQHVELSEDSAGYLKIKSKALLSRCIECEERPTRHDLKAGEWFTTDDRVEFSDGAITSICRECDFIKIGGESVDMVRLDKILEEEKLALSLQCDCALVALPDARLGQNIHLAVAGELPATCQPLVERFKVRVAPFEQIRGVFSVESIPRSPLNKVLRKAIMNYE